MKPRFLIFLLIIQFNLYGQYIDGPANVRFEPKGKLLFSLDNYIQLNRVQQIGDWYKITLIVLVDKDSCTQKLVKKNVVLRNHRGERIGNVLETFEYDYELNFVYDKYKRISISGYTFKSNILNDIPIENKDIEYYETNQSYIMRYNLVGGGLATEKLEVEYLSPSCFYDKELIIRKIKKEKTTDGHEGCKTTIQCDFIYNNNKNDSDNFTIKHDCDDIEFERNYYRTLKYGCCGAETYYEVFNYQNNKPLICFNITMIKITGGDDNLTYFIGYLPINNSETLELGKLYFASEKERLNEVTFIAKDEAAFNKVLPWTPDYNFSPEKYKLGIDYPRKVEYELNLNTYKSNFAPNVYNLYLDNFTIDIEFMDDATGEVSMKKIPVIYGYLFSSREKKTIYVDFNK